MIMRQDVLKTFDQWAESGRGDSMANGHWPRTRQIISQMNLTPGMAVLDVGCGNGYAVRAMLDVVGETGRGAGVDISESMVDLAINHSQTYANSTFVHAPAENLPFEENTFDRVLSVEAVYYAPDVHGFLSGVFRVLKPGGSCWLMVDYYEENPYSKDWASLLGFDLYRGSEASYRDVLEKAGFTAIKTSRIMDPTPVNAETFKPGWGYETLDDVTRFRTEVGSLLIHGAKP